MANEEVEHGGGKTLDELMRDTALIDLGATRAMVEARETREEAETEQRIAQQMGDVARQEHVRLRNELSSVTEVFNLEGAGTLSLDMIEHALRIMAGLGADSAMIDQCKAVLYGDTFQDILQKGTQFSAFDGQADMRIATSPGRDDLALKINVFPSRAELRLVLSDKVDFPVEQIATGTQIIAKYMAYQAMAALNAKELMDKLPVGSAKAGRAVVACAEMGRTLAESSLEAGDTARSIAADAQVPLRDYAISTTEEVGRQDYGKNTEEVEALMSMVDELSHLESNRETIEAVLHILAQTYHASTTSKTDRIDLITNVILHRNGTAGHVSGRSLLDKERERANARLEALAIIEAAMPSNDGSTIPQA